MRTKRKSINHNSDDNCRSSTSWRLVTLPAVQFEYEYEKRNVDKGVTPSMEYIPISFIPVQRNRNVLNLRCDMMIGNHSRA